MKKYPDNVVWDNDKQRWVANILPYPTNVGAPLIKVENVDIWKQKGISKTNHYLETKLSELKEEYLKLAEEFKWNDLIYNAKFYGHDIDSYVEDIVNNRRKNQ